MDTQLYYILGVVLLIVLLPWVEEKFAKVKRKISVPPQQQKHRSTSPIGSRELVQQPMIEEGSTAVTQQEVRAPRATTSRRPVSSLTSSSESSVPFKQPSRDELRKAIIWSEILKRKF